jgi:predicted nucleic acid-binding protein
MDVMRNVNTTAKVFERATELAWSLDRRGRTLPLQDIVIAACAQTEGAAVLTSDKHFLQIPGLAVSAPDFL